MYIVRQKYNQIYLLRVMTRKGVVAYMLKWSFIFRVGPKFGVLNTSKSKYSLHKVRKTYYTKIMVVNFDGNVKAI